VHEVDVRDFAEVQRVVNETVETYGHLDFIFNNAGISVGVPLEYRSVFLSRNSE
jgi:glucose 1-dehydrogenase